MSCKEVITFWLDMAAPIWLLSLGYRARLRSPNCRIPVNAAGPRTRIDVCPCRASDVRPVTERNIAGRLRVSSARIPPDPTPPNRGHRTDAIPRPAAARRSVACRSLFVADSLAVADRGATLDASRERGTVALEPAHHAARVAIPVAGQRSLAQSYARVVHDAS